MIITYKGRQIVIEFNKQDRKSYKLDDVYISKAYYTDNSQKVPDDTIDELQDEFGWEIQEEWSTT